MVPMQPTRPMTASHGETKESVLAGITTPPTAGAIGELVKVQSTPSTSVMVMMTPPGMYSKKLVGGRLLSPAQLTVRTQPGGTRSVTVYSPDSKGPENKWDAPPMS